jgi:hypothetical protein
MFLMEIRTIRSKKGSGTTHSFTSIGHLDSQNGQNVASGIEALCMVGAAARGLKKLY